MRSNVRLIAMTHVRMLTTLMATTHVRMLATLAAAIARPMKDKLTLRSSTRKARTNVAPAEWWSVYTKL